MTTHFSSDPDQFALAKRIEALAARVASARKSAGALQKELLALRAKLPAGSKARFDEVQRQLTAIRGIGLAENPSNAGWQPSPTLTSLRALEERLGDLMSAVDGADAAPSPDARRGVEKAEPLVEEGLAAWERFRKGDLPRLNVELKRRGLAPLDL